MTMGKRKSVKYTKDNKPQRDNYEERYRALVGSPGFEELRRCGGRKSVPYINEFEPRVQTVFLKHLASSGNVSYACQQVGVSKLTLVKTIEKDKTFAALYEEATQFAADMLEYEARRRAVEGVEKGVWNNGEFVGTEIQYSDGLLSLLLKANLPEKFKQRSQIDMDQRITVCSFCDMVDLIVRKENGEDVSDYYSHDPFGHNKHAINTSTEIGEEVNG